jgi:ABC-type glycerol-3-phosphate transport system permease component
LNTGVYFTGTGPTAITLRDLNASTVVTPWPLILAAVIVVATIVALGLVFRRRAVRA